MAMMMQPKDKEAESSAKQPGDKEGVRVNTNAFNDDPEVSNAHATEESAPPRDGEAAKAKAGIAALVKR